MLQVSKLTCKAGKKTLLNELSFEAKQGEILAIVGANGAGKSTLIKLLSREQKPVSGQILLNGIDLQTYKSDYLARIRAVLSQQYFISLPFKVHEIVMMGRYPFFEYNPHKKDSEITALALQKVKMSDFTDRQYHTLSGGEQQRVQLARVLAQIWETENGLLLLDEPTTGLDILHQHQIIEIARDFARQGFCVIAVLHDLNLAMQYADKVLILKNGHLQAFGPTRQTLTPEHIHLAFGLPVQCIEVPEQTHPFIVTDTQLLHQRLKEANSANF
jgi:iron complex transport system ATP-binding protein